MATGPNNKNNKKLKKIKLYKQKKNDKKRKKCQLKQIIKTTPNYKLGTAQFQLHPIFRFHYLTVSSSRPYKAS